MKRTVLLFLYIAIFWGCEQIQLPENTFNDGAVTEGEATEDELPEVIYAYAANDEKESQTRTFVDGNKVLWHSGDEIFYCSGRWIGAKYVYNGQDGAASAEFTKVTDGTVDDQGSFSLAVFPYNDKISAEFNNNQTWTIIPEYHQEQTYLPDSFDKDANIMIAVGKNATDDNLFFRNACGYLVIKLYGMNVKIRSIWLGANDENLRLMGKKYAIEVNHDGEFVFNENEIVPDISHPESNIHSVTMDCGNDGVKIGDDSEHATEFWFALPPMTIAGGITVRIEDTYGNVITKETGKDIEIALNKVQPMAAFDVTNNDKVTKLWYRTAEDPTESNLLSRFGDKNDNYAEASEYFDANIKKHGPAHYRRDVNSESRYMQCIEFDRPLTEIRKDAFKDAGITEIIFPDGLETISESAFEDNEMLEVINFPETLTTIGKCAFENTGITSLTISGNVTYMGHNAFAECESLLSLTFQPGDMAEPLVIDAPDKYAGNEYTPFYESDNITVLSLNRELVKAHAKVTMALFQDHEALTTVTIGEQVKIIHGHMFYNAGKVTDGNPGIAKIAIPGSVTLIESAAFRECKVKNIIIEENSDKTMPRTIGGSAFEKCETLTSITIPEGVTIIDDCAFFHCSSLQSITIPGSVTEIGRSTFDGCTSLSSVTFNAGENLLTIDNIYVNHGSFWESEVGPFYYSPLTSIDLDRDIIMAEGYLAELDSENEGVFSCQKYNDENHQTTLTIGTNVTKIQPYMFAQSAITSVAVPANVTEIGYNAFLYCTKLTTINIEDSSTPLTLGYIEWGTFSSEYGPFYDSPLSSITLKRDIKYVKKTKDELFTPDQPDEGVFSNKVKNQTKVTLGGGLRNILPYMFCMTGVGAAVNQDGQFTGVAGSVWIPHTIESIGNNAFYDCDKLAGLTMGYDGTTYLPSIGTRVFGECDNFSYIKVRKNQLSKFQNSDIWNPYESKLVTSDDFQ